MKPKKIVLLIALLMMIVLVSNANATLQGVVAYYPFQDMTAKDVIGTYNGQVVGAASTEGLNGGKAFYFDGIDDYISLPRSVSDDFTIVFWVSTTQTAGTELNGYHQWYAGNGLVDAETCDVVDDFGTALLGSKASFGKGGATDYIDVTIESSSNINDGKWHQVVAVRQKSSGEMKLYVDGKLEAKGIGTSNSLTASNDIYIGNNPCHVGDNINWFQGKIDEVQIYSRALTGSEIQNLYKCDFTAYSFMEKCFGGIGSQCDTFGKTNLATCKVKGIESGGSILHDQCCITTSQTGTWCANADPNNNACDPFWQLATNDATFGMYWDNTWGPYYPGGIIDGLIPDDINQLLSLKAPSGQWVAEKYSTTLCPTGRCVTYKKDLVVTRLVGSWIYCKCK